LTACWKCAHIDLVRDSILAGRRLWFPAFLASLVVLAASLGALAVVLLSAVGSDNGEGPLAVSDPSPAPSATTTPASAASPTATETPSAISYSGELPPGLSSAGLVPAAEGLDLAFVQGEVYRIVRRYFLPVAAIGTGVDALTSEQLSALMHGEISDWKDVGGVPGPVRFFAGGPAQDLALVASFTAGATPAETFDSYAELRAALTLDSGAFAFLPLDEVGPTVMAIAVDGADLVRGRGSPARWPFTDSLTIVPFTAEGRATAEALVAEHSAQLPDPITVVATGDILQSRCSLAAIQATGDWGAALRGPVGEYLASADLALGSVDGSIQDLAPVLGCSQHTNLSSPPEVIEALTLAGFDEVTVATNHVFDCGTAQCGAQAMLRTIALLREAGIAVVGGGRDLEEALAPAILTVGAITFGILGFDDVAAYELEAGEDRPGTAPLDDDYSDELASGEPAFFRPAEELSLDRFEERIRNLATAVDVVIVQVQSGREEINHNPSPRSIKALRAAVDAGAALVVGNQAHHVQAIEPSQEAFIAYALGNFIFDQVSFEEHTQGYLLEATFWGAKLVNLRFLPYVIEKQYRPVFAEGAIRVEILTDIFEASKRLAAAE